MGADENPSIQFCKLATLEHVYSNTQGHLTDNDMIGSIFAVAPEKYRATLNVTVENHGAALQPSQLEAAMRKIWRQIGGSKGLNTAKRGSEIVLIVFTGICYMCKEKGHQAMHCPNKEAKGRSKSGKGGFKGDKAIDSTEIAIIVKSKDTGRHTFGSCLQKGQQVTLQGTSTRMSALTAAKEWASNLYFVPLILALFA